MTIPYNRTQLIRNALIYLGFPSIQSIDAGGSSAQAIDAVYDSILAADLSSPNWRFATKVAQLAQVAGFNPGYIFYNAAYQIPPDCLAIWQVYPSLPYDVYGEQIWTTVGNQKLLIQYRHWPVPESMLPPAYLEYFAWLLAYKVGPNITKDAAVLQEVEKRMTSARAQALVVNTQGRPNNGLTDSSWVNSRPAGSFYGTSWTT